MSLQQWSEMNGRKRAVTPREYWKLDRMIGQARKAVIKMFLDQIWSLTSYQAQYADFYTLQITNEKA
jgi:hypothetical protein